MFQNIEGENRVERRVLKRNGLSRANNICRWIIDDFAGDHGFFRIGPKSRSAIQNFAVPLSHVGDNFQGDFVVEMLGNVQGRFNLEVLDVVRMDQVEGMGSLWKLRIAIPALDGFAADYRRAQPAVALGAAQMRVNPFLLPASGFKVSRDVPFISFFFLEFNLMKMKNGIQEAVHRGRAQQPEHNGFQEAVHERNAPQPDRGRF